MASTRELQQRIKSVGNIKQITRAMEMVATTKLRRFQDRAVASRPYSREIAGLVGRLAAVLGDDLEGRPLFQPGAGEATAVLLVSSDRGLCGAYNTNVMRFLEGWLAEREAAATSTGASGGGPVDFYVIGRRGYQYLTKTDRNVERFLVEPPLDKMDYRGAAYIARTLAEEFLSGRYRNVQLIFTAFESMVKYVPTRMQLLPIVAEELMPESKGEPNGESARADSDVILEPDAATIFDTVVPRYLETAVFNALLESLTSEFASRRFSMKNATEAANDMQDVLQGLYNRQRQSSITMELLDIVGGVEALK